MRAAAVFTKRIGRSRSAYVIWIPKDVATLIRLEDSDIVEVTLRKLGGETQS